MTGRSFDTEPEDLDSRNYIDFEGERPTNDEAVYLWTVGALWTVVVDCLWKNPSDDRLIAVTMDDLTDTLKRVGEGPTWELLETALVDKGYGVYNSDTRFEVYDPGTWDNIPIDDDEGEDPYTPELPHSGRRW